MAGLDGRRVNVLLGAGVLRSLDVTVQSRQILADPSQISDKSQGHWTGIAASLRDPATGIHGKHLTAGDRSHVIFEYNTHLLNALAAVNRPEQIATFIGVGRDVLKDQIEDEADPLVRGALTALYYQLLGVELEPKLGNIAGEAKQSDVRFPSMVLPKLEKVTSIDGARELLAERDLDTYETHFKQYVATATDTRYGFDGSQTNIAQADMVWHQSVVQKAQQNRRNCDVVYTVTRDTIAQTLNDTTTLPASRKTTRGSLGVTLREDLTKVQDGYAEAVAAQIQAGDPDAISEHVSSTVQTITDKRIGKGKEADITDVERETNKKILTGLKTVPQEFTTTLLDEVSVAVGSSNDLVAQGELNVFTNTTLDYIGKSYADTTAVSFTTYPTEIQDYVTTMSGYLTDPNIGVTGKMPVADKLIGINKEVVTQAAKQGDKVAGELYEQVIDLLPNQLAATTDEKKADAIRTMLHGTLTGVRGGYVRMATNQLAQPGSDIGSYLDKTINLMTTPNLRSQGQEPALIAKTLLSTHEEVMQAVALRDSSRVTALVAKTLDLAPTKIHDADRYGKEALVSVVRKTIGICAPSYFRSVLEDIVSGKGTINDFVQIVVNVITDPTIGVAGEQPLAEEIWVPLYIPVLHNLPSDKLRADFYENTIKMVSDRVNTAESNDPTINNGLRNLAQQTIAQTQKGICRYQAEAIQNETSAEKYWTAYTATITQPPFGAGGKCELLDEFKTIHTGVIAELAQKKDVAHIQAFIKAGIDTTIKFIGETDKPDVSMHLLTSLLDLLTNSPLQEAVKAREKAELVREATTFDVARRYFVATLCGREHKEKVGAIDFNVAEAEGPHKGLLPLLSNFLEADAKKSTPQANLVHIALIALRERAGHKILEGKTDAVADLRLGTERTLRKAQRQALESETLTHPIITALFGHMKLLSPAALLETVGFDPAVRQEVSASHPHNRIREEAGAAFAATTEGQSLGGFNARYLMSGTLHPEFLSLPEDPKITELLGSVVAVEGDKGSSVLQLAQKFVNMNGRWSGLGPNPPGIPYLLASSSTLKGAGFKEIPEAWETTRTSIFKEIANTLIANGGYIHDKRFVDGSNAQFMSLAVFSLLYMGRVLVARAGEDEGLKEEYRRGFVSSLTQILTDKDNKYCRQVKDAALKVVENCLPYFDIKYQKQYVDEIVDKITRDPWYLDQDENDFYKSIMWLAKRQNDGAPDVPGQQDVYRPISDYVSEKFSGYLLETYPYIDKVTHRRFVIGGMLGLSTLDLRSSENVKSKLGLPGSVAAIGRRPIPEKSPVGRLLDIIIDTATYTSPTDAAAKRTFADRVGVFGGRFETALQGELNDIALLFHPFKRQTEALVADAEDEILALNGRIAREIEGFGAHVAELPTPPSHLVQVADILEDANGSSDLKEKVPLLATIMQQVEDLVGEAEIDISGGKESLIAAQVDRTAQLETLVRQLTTGQIALTDVSELMEGMTKRTELPKLPKTSLVTLPEGALDTSGRVNLTRMGRAYGAIIQSLAGVAGSQTAATNTEATQVLLTERALSGTQDAAIVNAVGHAFEEVLAANKDTRDVVVELIQATGAQEDAQKMAALRFHMFDKYVQLHDQFVARQSGALADQLVWDGRRREILQTQFEQVKQIIEIVFTHMRTTLNAEAGIGQEIKAEERRRRQEVLALWKQEFDRRLKQRQEDIELRESTIATFREARKEARIQADALQTKLSAQNREWRKELSEDAALDVLADATIAAAKSAKLDIVVEVPTPSDLLKARRRSKKQELKTT